MLPAAPYSLRDASSLPMFQQWFMLNRFIPIATEEDRPRSRLLCSSFAVETSSITQKQLCALSSNM